MNRRLGMTRRGMALLYVMAVLGSVSALALMFADKYRSESLAAAQQAKVESLDLVTKSILDEAKYKAHELKSDTPDLYSSYLGSGDDVLASAGSLAKFDGKLKSYTYNYALIDNDDGDGLANKDSDGRIFAKIRVFHEGNTVRTTNAFFQVEKPNTYVASPIYQLPGAVTGCMNEEKRQFNFGIKTKGLNSSSDRFDIDGDDHDSSGTRKSDSEKHLCGLTTNGTFNTSWYADISDDIDNIKGHDNLSGADSIGQHFDKCDSYNDLEERLFTYIDENSDDPSILRITPSTVSYSLTNQKIIVFDAREGGLLQVNPASGSSTITLGTSGAGVIVVVLGKEGRCTENVSASFFGGLMTPCPYSSGDGTVRFNGDVTGYGLFFQNGAMDVTGNLTWKGYVHAVLGAANIEASSSSSVCTSSEDEEEEDDDDDDGKGGKKVAICHIPPGNPYNKKTLKVASSAVSAHLRHGDTSGECPDSETSSATKTCNVSSTVPEDIGKTFEVRGNFKVLGGLYVGRAQGASILGGLTHKGYVNHHLVFRGSEHYAKYSYDILSDVAQLYSKTFPNTGVTFAMFAF